MKEAMLQLQLLVPLLDLDSSVTANLKRGEELEVELESSIKHPVITSEQKIALKYGNFVLLFSQLLSFNHLNPIKLL